MKKSLYSLLALIALSFAGCTNIPVTKSVYNGYELSQAEKQRVLYGRVNALEHRGVGESYSWISSLYDMRATIEILDEFEINESLCKKFVETIKKSVSTSQTTEIVSCRNGLGIWSDV